MEKELKGSSVKKLHKRNPKKQKNELKLKK